MTIVSFYSFKGGVGRTFAALETSAQLAGAGFRVCFWDLDLEAPGLHMHRQLQPDLHRLRSGTLELFENAQDSGIVEPALVDRAIVRCHAGGDRYIHMLLPSSLDALTSPSDSSPSSRSRARRPEPYSARYWAIDWQAQFETKRGINLFLSIADHLAGRFDVVIIDARTGLTDLGLLSTRVLADAVVLVFGLSDQNLDGVRRAYSAITTRVGSQKPPPVFLVANLVPDEVARSSNPRLAEGYRNQRAILNGLQLAPDVELPLVPARLIDDLVPSLPGGATDEARPFAPIAAWVEAHLPISAGDRHPGPGFENEANFTKEVAELFLHAGWRVEQTSEGPGIAPDLRLERVDPLLPRFAVVECKGGRGRVGRDAVAQVVAIRDAIEGQASRRYEAYVVSRNGFTASAREAAQENSVALATIRDLVKEVLDPSPILWWLHDEAGRTAAASVYIPPDGVVSGRKTSRPVGDLVDSWLEVDDSRLLVLVGGPGSGKTSFLLHYATMLADRWQENPLADRWPLYLPLRNVSSDDISFDALIRSVDELGLPHVSPKALRFLNRSGRLVLLIDGLDEAHELQDVGELIMNSLEGRAKVITTSRPSSILKTQLAAYNPSVITLRPLSSEGVGEFLKLRAGGASSHRLLAALDKNPRLAELARVPLYAELLLYMGHTQSKSIQSASDLIENAVLAWLNRRPSGPPDPGIAVAFLREMAWTMWSLGTTAIHGDHLVRIWARLTTTTGSDDEGLGSLLRSCVFLDRVGGSSYAFSHGVYSDFFLAEQLVVAALARLDITKLHVPRLSQGVVAFVRDILQGSPALEAFTSWLLRILLPEMSIASGETKTNALILLHAVAPRKKVAGAELAGTNLSGVDLAKAKLPGAILRGASLSHSSLMGVDFTSADLSDADLTSAILTGASLRGANLEGANLQGAVLEGADLREANLARAKTTGAYMGDGSPHPDPEEVYRQVLDEQRAKGMSPQVAEARAKVARVKAERGIPLGTRSKSRSQPSV